MPVDAVLANADMTQEQVLYWMAANLAVHGECSVKVCTGTVYPLRTIRVAAYPNGVQYGSEFIPFRERADPGDPYALRIVCEQGASAETIFETLKSELEKV